MICTHCVLHYASPVWPLSYAHTCPCPVSTDHVQIKLKNSSPFFVAIVVVVRSVAINRSG